MFLHEDSEDVGFEFSLGAQVLLVLPCGGSVITSER